MLKFANLIQAHSYHIFNTRSIDLFVIIAYHFGCSVSRPNIFINTH